MGNSRILYLGKLRAGRVVSLCSKYKHSSSICSTILTQSTTGGLITNPGIPKGGWIGFSKTDPRS